MEEVRDKGIHTVKAQRTPREGKGRVRVYTCASPLQEKIPAEHWLDVALRSSGAVGMRDTQRGSKKYETTIPGQLIDHSH